MLENKNHLRAKEIDTNNTQISDGDITIIMWHYNKNIRRKKKPTENASLDSATTSKKKKA